MESATWCRTPVAASAARRLRPEVSKNSSTALSSNEGELARSITTCAPARASLSPSPVMVLTPLLGEAARISGPPWRRMATVFEPIRPVPPITTIFISDLLGTQGSEPRAQLFHEELRLFPRREVPALVELVVMDEPGIRPLRPAPRRRDDVVGKNAYRNRDGDVLGAQVGLREPLPIKTRRGDGRVRQPEERGVVEHIV